VTVEHLDYKEWRDVTQYRYRATGENEWSVAITESKPMGSALVEALKDNVSGRTH
jgi:hypothetical protein